MEPHAWYLQVVEKQNKLTFQDGAGLFGKLELLNPWNQEKGEGRGEFHRATSFQISIIEPQIYFYRCEVKGDLVKVNERQPCCDEGYITCEWQEHPRTIKSEIDLEATANFIDSG